MNDPVPPPVPDPLPRFPPKKILVPVDRSEPSESAVAAAMELGRRWSASLELLHVNDETPPGLLQGADAPREQRRLKEYYQELEDDLRGLAAGYPDVAVRLEDGQPKRELPPMAAPGTADWVVMGTHGRAGLAHVALGSVAEAVVHAARVPVLTVRAKPAAGWPRNILVPMKFTEYADRCLLYAAALADDVGAALSVLFVAEQGAGAGRSFEPLERHLAEILGRERFARLGRIEASGHPAETILHAADREHCDLIALAAHRKPFLESLVLGTTAERVLRHSRAPVLSVPSVSPARGDREDLNLLALNVANDVATGAREPGPARSFYVKTATLLAAGKSAPYAERLRFQPYRAAPPLSELER